MSIKRKYEINDNEIIIATAPESRIGLRPHRSTRYQGGIVEARYVKALIPVIKMASRPTQPADSKTRGA